MTLSMKRMKIDDDRLVEMLFKRNLLDDPITTNEYLEIIHDYMISGRELTRILNRASNSKKKHPDFDYYRFIIYSLIKLGKEGNKSIEKE